MSDVTQAPLPSARSLAVATLGAAALAVVILFTLVLPAEYGFDPLGTGRALGLTAIAHPVAAPVALPAGSELKPVANGPESQYSAPFRTETVQFTIDPYDYLEYKYQLEAGAQMQFSWRASAPVIHEFHGEHAEDANNVMSYDKSTRQEAHGALTAPFTGIHGWYWENQDGTPVTVTLTSSGFYASAIEFHSDKTTVAHQLKTP